MAFLFDDHGMLMGGKQRVLSHLKRVAQPGYVCTLLPDPRLPAAPGYSNDPPQPGAVRALRVDPQSIPLLGTNALCPVEELFRLNLAATLFFCTEQDMRRVLRMRIRNRPPNNSAEEEG